MRIKMAASIAALSFVLGTIGAFGLDEPGSLRSFKGWELYSWKAGKCWQFSLLNGTNRTKTCAEIKGSKKTLTAIELDAALSKLAKGEYVVWVSNKAPNVADECSLGMPPNSVANRIKSRCKKRDLILSVSP